MDAAESYRGGVDMIAPVRWDDIPEIVYVLAPINTVDLWDHLLTVNFRDITLVPTWSTPDGAEAFAAKMSLPLQPFDVSRDELRATTQARNQRGQIPATLALDIDDYPIVENTIPATCWQ